MERFVPNPFSPVPGSRMYKTGDLVIQRTDGMFAFVGRADTQFKVRGYRIEAGELEVALESIEGIAASMVGVVTGSGGEEHLAAFVVPRSAYDFDKARILERLQTKVPRWMIPSILRVVDSIPRTPNGKPDRAAFSRIAKS